MCKWPNNENNVAILSHWHIYSINLNYGCVPAVTNPAMPSSLVPRLNKSYPSYLKEFLQVFRSK